LNPRNTGVAGDLVESKEALGWTGGLVETKEHWGGPVTWLIPRSTGMDR
jgi:hypothetical protein